MLFAALRRERTPQTDGRKRARSSRPLWVFTIGSAVALWFMTTSMFLRFHAVETDRVKTQKHRRRHEPERNRAANGEHPQRTA